MSSEDATGSKRKGHAGGRKQVEDDPPTKKIAQQREASRKFRERKEQYVKDLEAAVAELSKGSKPTEELRQRVAALEVENALLRQATFSFDPLSSVLVNQSLQTPPTNIGTSSLDDLFPNMNPPLHFDTFKQTHLDINFESLFSEKELEVVVKSSASVGHAVPINNSLSPTQVIEKLVNVPLPTPPSDDEVIKPHFVGARRALENLPSLRDRHALVEELIDHYVSFINYKTGTEPMTCRYTFGLIKMTEGKVLEECVKAGVTCDIDTCMFVFEAVKKKYFICDRQDDDEFMGFKGE
ncbi:UNVERIFIED_CONTAM: hypothetical protein HDU68_009400 [Siphonaria sp. JEL0065]|nr:hypothetical protein HDU68_009400 [Siphonaria sp. JEL0065]